MRRLPAPARWSAGLVPWLLAAYLLVLARITMWPAPVDAPVREDLDSWLARLHALGLPGWVGYAAVESSANVLLFVPFGLLLLVHRPARGGLRTVAAGALVSVVVEVFQLVVLDRRVASPRDLVMNTLGTLVGVLLVRAAQAVRGSAAGRPNQ